MRYNFQRYFPSNPHDSIWGISVTTIGSQTIQPGDSYPAGQHPESHRLNDHEGRVLDEYQMLLITAGRGTYWSEKSGTIPIESGTIFFNFKGVRHRYAPDPEIGWAEYWIGFKGPYIEKLIEACFDPEKPNIRVGDAPDLVRHYQESFDLAKVNDIGHGGIIATKALQAIAKTHTLKLQLNRSNSFHDKTVRAACCKMNAAIEEPFSADAFADEHGMSLTSFRRNFKLVTGVSPVQYLLDLRFRKAQHLLRNTNLSIKVIALECGFSNALYFSRFYKSRTGKAPSEFRT